MHNNVAEAMLYSNDEVEVKERIKASVVKNTISSIVGWGNTTIFKSLEQVIVSGAGGYITSNSLDDLIDKTLEYAEKAESPIQQNQLMRLQEYLLSLVAQ